jgi:hypothetical protein
MPSASLAMRGLRSEKFAITVAGSGEVLNRRLLLQELWDELSDAHYL